MNRFTVKLEIEGKQDQEWRTIYVYQEKDDLEFIFQARKEDGYFPCTSKLTLASLFRLKWEKMMKRIGVSDR